MSVRSMKNYDEWPRWNELAESMAMAAAFKIVHSGIYHYGWQESPSAVVDMSRDDLVDFMVKLRMAHMKMASSPSAMMSIVGGFGGDIDLSDDAALVSQSNSLIGYLTGQESVEPLACTSSGKAWARMCGYLHDSESFKALMTFISEWRGGETMKGRIRKYGLITATTSNAYTVTDASFKEAYPDEFKKGFWASIFN